MTRQASTHGSAKAPWQSPWIPKTQLQDEGTQSSSLQDCPGQGGSDVSGPWRQQPPRGRGEGHIWGRKGHTWSTQTPCPGGGGGGGSGWQPSRFPSAPVTF